MGLIKQILFKSVLVVILLHALIPHRHYDEMSEKEHFALHQNNDNIIDLVKIFFHENNDESLDNLLFAQFNIQKTTQSKTPILNEEFEGYINVENKLIQKNTSPYGVCYITIFVDVNGLRGPPKMSLI
ncbi:hypothetical protein [Lutibacter sp.]